ncbi:MAG: SDR family NAD(P)-dependent oxidoreductase [Spirochaetales bacterium]|nr:SDR family NAD(P)-dependent oxidoreductase [Spirochaetales bacterium]
MGLFRYLLQYSVRDMAEFLRNEKKPPAQCGGDLQGKTVVISGATSGIGLETARLFASRGANLVCLNRDPVKSERLENELENRYGRRPRTIPVDFGSLKRTKECARRLLELSEPMDVLIHNSGVYHTRRRFSADGLEIVFQVNHLSHFCLNYLLKERLRGENRARILYVNSEGHRFALAGVHLDDLDWNRRRYTGLKSYGAAKTAQLLTMMKFAEYFSGSTVTVNAMHPGNVKSALGENNGRFYRWLKRRLILASAGDPAVSAAALLYLSVSADVERDSGRFFNLTTPEKPAPHARDRAAAEAVWKKSLELCGLP